MTFVPQVLGTGWSPGREDAIPPNGASGDDCIGATHLLMMPSEALPVDDARGASLHFLVDGNGWYTISPLQICLSTPLLRNRY